MMDFSPMDWHQIRNIAMAVFLGIWAHRVLSGVLGMLKRVRLRRT